MIPGLFASILAAVIAGMFLSEGGVGMAAGYLIVAIGWGVIVVFAGNQ